MINKLTLGTVATYYKLSDSSVKNRVIEKMLTPEFQDNFSEVIIKNFFSDLIYLMQSYRNCASHGERVYDYVPSDENDGFKNADKIFTYIHSNDDQYSSSGLFPLIVSTSSLRNPAPTNILSSINLEINNIKKDELTLFYYFLEVMNYAPDFWRELI